MESGSEPGILISRAAAKLLGCRSGDELTLYITTDAGQYNTANLIVRGVFDETSLFGYIAYMRNADLNRLLLRQEGAATDISVYVRSGQNIDKTAGEVVSALGAKHAVGPLFASREERDAALGALVQEPTLVVLTQGAQLAQIRQLLDALLIITYGVLGIFLTIVMAGILNTYRVLVHERRREIGVMRALGMQRSAVRRLFIAEAALLAVLSSLVGLALALGLLKIISWMNLSFIPGSGLFLEGGRLRMSLSLSMTAANGGLMLLAAVLAAWGPARKAGSIRPADAMRSA
jgi:putative ABC transport system permease protein